METVIDFIFLGSKITADGDCSPEIKNTLAHWKESYDQPRQHIKSRDIANKGPSSQSYDFSSSHVWMWELNRKESWVLKNWCFWSVVLEKTLESPLDCKEIKPVNPKGNQSWLFTGSTDAEAEIPILWLPVVKNSLIGKDLMLGKIEVKRRGWQRMRWLEDKLNGHEFEQALRVGDGQGSLACCSPWGFRVGHDWATQLNWT